MGEERGQIDVLTLIFPAFVSAAVASTVQSHSQSNIAYRLQSCGGIEQSDFLGKNRFVT